MSLLLRRARIATVAAVAAAALAISLLLAVSASAATTNCSKTGQISAGDYIIQMNEWNSSTLQCVTYTGGTAWSVTTANMNAPTNGGPGTYPSIFKGCHWGSCTANSGMPIQVSRLASATTSWSATLINSGAYDVAYDLWFNSTPTTLGQPDGTEIMIWLNSRGGVQPFGSLTGTAQLAGLKWNVWTGQQSSWKIISYVLNPGTSSVTNVDAKALITDAVARRSLNPAHYLIDAEAGFEIWQGGQGLTSDSFSFNATAMTTGGDTQAPSAPTSLRSTGTTSSSVALTWSASTDNVAVTGYDVYRDGAKVASPTGTSYTDTGLAASTSHSYTVKAHDAAGNQSAASNSLTATTAGSGTGNAGCTATYHLDNAWSTGFTATVTVVNTGTTATRGWRVSWVWPSGQRVTNMWSGTGVASGAGETVTNVGYNGVIQPRQSAAFGFQAGSTGGNTAPTLTCTVS